MRVPTVVTVVLAAVSSASLGANARVVNRDETASMFPAI